MDGVGTGDPKRPIRPESSRIEQYELDRELGRGGMAAVFLAHDRKHGRRVAVKVLHAELAAMLGPDRFVQEIRVLATLQHPHILGLIDSGVFADHAGELRGRQATGEKAVDARADVYALGCVLYEMLTGEPPFTGPSAQAIVARVMTEQPVAPVARRATIPSHVEDAVLTAIESCRPTASPTPLTSQLPWPTRRHARGARIARRPRRALSIDGPSPSSPGRHWQ